MANKIQLIGIVAELPRIKEGTAIKASFLLGETPISKPSFELNNKTRYHNIVAFNKMAKMTRDYIGKGNKIAIEGELTYNNMIAEIVVNSMMLIGSCEAIKKADYEIS